MGTGDGALVIAAVRDMTQHQAAETERRRLHLMSAVVESSVEAIIADRVRIELAAGAGL